MSLNAPYDADNVFAKIIRGDLPCTKVDEDEDTLSFMDLHPQSPGHTLVISKTAQAVNLFDIDAKQLNALIERVQIIGRAIQTALRPDGIKIMQFNGAPAGQTVYHLHFHIIPIFEDVAPKAHGDTSGGPASDLEAIAAKIRAAL